MIHDVAIVFSPYVFMNVRGLLRGELAVRTLEPRWLSALVSHVSHQAPFLTEDAAAVGTRVSLGIRDRANVVRSMIRRQPGDGIIFVS